MLSPRRNFSHCTTKVRFATYVTSVRPTLDPSMQQLSGTPTVRKTPRCLKRQIVEQQGTTATTSETARTPGIVQSLLDSLKWNGLEQRRLHNRLQMLHMISSGLVDINITGFCQHGDPMTTGAQRLHQGNTRHPVLFNCFFLRTIRDWNRLTTDITSATSLRSFRNQLGGSLHNLQAIPTAPRP